MPRFMPAMSPVDTVSISRGTWMSAALPVRGQLLRWGIATICVGTGVMIGAWMDSPGLGAVVGLGVGGAWTWVLPAWVQRQLEGLEQDLQRADHEGTKRWITKLEGHRIVDLLAPHAWVAFQKGQLYLRLGQGKAAARSFAEAARMLGDVDHTELLSIQAHALLMDGDTKGAMDVLTTLEDSDRLSARDKMNLGIALISEPGQRKLAIRQLEDAFEVLGDEPRVQAGLAFGYAKDGRIDASRALLEQLDEGDDHPAPVPELIKRAKKAIRRKGARKVSRIRIETVEISPEPPPPPPPTSRPSSSRRMLPPRVPDTVGVIEAVDPELDITAPTELLLTSEALASRAPNDEKTDEWDDSGEEGSEDASDSGEEGSEDAGDSGEEGSEDASDSDEEGSEDAGDSDEEGSEDASDSGEEGSDETERREFRGGDSDETERREFREDSGGPERQEPEDGSDSDDSEPDEEFREDSGGPERQEPEDGSDSDDSEPDEEFRADSGESERQEPREEVGGSDEEGQEFCANADSAEERRGFREDARESDELTQKENAEDSGPSDNELDAETTDRGLDAKDVL